MDLRTIADLLWFRVWWSYRRRGQVDWVEVPYHAFNLVEGTAWLALAGLVLRRYRHHRRSPVEVAYALAFATFGLTDFVEAYALTSWLLWLKGVNLLILARFRAVVIARHYPASRLF